jgi:hypothetical protein
MEIAATSKNPGNSYLNVAKIHRINDTFDDKIHLECCQRHLPPQAPAACLKAKRVQKMRVAAWLISIAALFSRDLNAHARVSLVAAFGCGSGIISEAFCCDFHTCSVGGQDPQERQSHRRHGGDSVRQICFLPLALPPQCWFDRRGCGRDGARGYCSRYALNTAMCCIHRCLMLGSPRRGFQHCFFVRNTSISRNYRATLGGESGCRLQPGHERRAAGPQSTWRSSF